MQIAKCYWHCPQNRSLVSTSRSSRLSLTLRISSKAGLRVCFLTLVFLLPLLLLSGSRYTFTYLQGNEWSREASLAMEMGLHKSCDRSLLLRLNGNCDNKKLRSHTGSGSGTDRVPFLVVVGFLWVLLKLRNNRIMPSFMGNCHSINFQKGQPISIRSRDVAC